MEPKMLAAAAVLVALWLGEALVPFYTDFPGGFRERVRHGARNLGFGLFNAAVLVLLFSAAMVTVTSWSASREVGLLWLVDGPIWIKTVAAFFLFDAWMYVWHRANHEISFLWRFHSMHHSDLEMDATSAIRFHPIEILFSGTARLAVVPLLGMTLAQLAIYEAVMLPVILLHHSNVRLPRVLDHGLLALIVTPAMHRVHHSRLREETDSNYGSVFPYWDFLAGTFGLRKDAHAIRLGLDGMDGTRWQSMRGMLATPLATVDRRSRN